MGLMYTEELLVPRSWSRAYSFFKKASELGSDAAKITKKEMERRGLDKTDTADFVTPGKEPSNNNTKRSMPIDTGSSLMFIDFHTDTTSTIEDTTTKELILSLIRQPLKRLQQQIWTQVFSPCYQ